MKQKGRKLKVARATIAGIKKEMQAPRLAKSVRDDPIYRGTPNPEALQAK
jgi:hypothetical protein